MKKTVLAFLVSLLVLSLASCGNAASPSTKAPEKAALKVGIAAPDATHGWVAGVAYYAEKYCKDNGLTYNIITSSDAAEMQTALQDLILWGADVIVAYPQWTGMEDAFEELVEQNVPVVNFDVEIAVDGLHFVTGDNYSMGYESAKRIAELIEDGATIAVLDVPSLGSVCALRKQGFYDYLKEIGYDTSNIFEVQGETCSREVGLRDMADILAAHDHIDAVYSMDDETSLGAIQAITEAGRTDIKVISGGGGCQDYFKVIADGKYADMNPFSATYSPMMIQDAIRLAIDLKKGNTVEAKTVIPTTIVTKDNVSSFLDSSNTIY